jgi:ferredoxin-NADP reductase
MNILIKIILFANLFFYNSNPAEYKYTLICTGKNCTPCITTAENLFIKNNTLPTIINLYDNEADKQFTKELIDDYCNKSDSRKKAIKKSFEFGRFTFKASDNGPFLIKYSKTDTIVFNASNIDDVN